MGMFNEFGSVSKDYYGWTEKTYAGADLPIHGVSVKFESENGKVSQDFALTDSPGILPTLLIYQNR